MEKNKKKLLGIAYVRLVQDEQGEVNFEYGYDIDKKQASLNDIMALQSFLGMLKDKADQDFKDRIDVSEKKYEVGFEDAEAEFPFKYIEIEGEKYKVPISVLMNLKVILEENPNLKKFKVKKTGEGMDTKYTVIPLS